MRTAFARGENEDYVGWLTPGRAELQARIVGVDLIENNVSIQPTNRGSVSRFYVSRPSQATRDYVSMGLVGCRISGTFTGFR